MAQLKSRQIRPREFLHRVKVFFTASLCFSIIFLLLFLPEDGLKGASDGLSLCADVVVPSLFPFLVVCVFFINTGLAEKIGRLFEPLMRKVFRLPGCAATAFGLGIIGGYPVGAKAAAGLCKKGALSVREGERLLTFCINSSPAFIIGAVGTGMLRSSKAGVFLYLAHITASLMVGIFMGFFHPESGRPEPARPIRSKPVARAFVYSVTDSAKSIVYICAFVVLFSSLTRLLTSSGALSGIAAIFNLFLPHPASDPAFYNKALIGFLEVTNGCAVCSAGSGMPALLMISAILGWSGLSVLFQIQSAIQDVGISVRLFILTRVIQMIFSVLLTYLLFTLFPVSIPAFAGGQAIPIAGLHSAPASAALLFLCAMLLLSLVKI